MRPADLFWIAFSALGRQRARTFLTVLAVVVGSATLVISVAVGRGVETAIIDQFRKSNQLRQVRVSPDYRSDEADAPEKELRVEGAMSDAKRARLRKAVVLHWNRTHFSRPNMPTSDFVRKVRALPHVLSIVPATDMDCTASIGGEVRQAQVTGVSADDEEVRRRVVAGEALPADASRVALVHERLLYTWGFTGDDDVRKVLGQRLRLEYQIGGKGASRLLTLLTGGRFDMSEAEHRTLDGALRRLPATLEATDLSAEERRVVRKTLAHLTTKRESVPVVRYSEEFTIVGVVRGVADDDPQATNWASREADVLLPTRAGEEFYLRAPRNAEEGFHQAVVLVDREENVAAVGKAVKGLGLNVYSLLELIEQIRHNVQLITFGVSLAAVAALAVAAIGIANTMVMGVLERTREIGVMKSVGARDRDVLRLFLVEGALIGLRGGAIGVLIGWLARFPGDAIAHWVMARRGTPSKDIFPSVFIYPPWLLVGVPVLAVLIATLAAIYPARRAARMSPVDSLRHD